MKKSFPTISLKSACAVKSVYAVISEHGFGGVMDGAQIVDAICAKDAARVATGTELDLDNTVVIDGVYHVYDNLPINDRQIHVTVIGPLDREYFDKEKGYKLGVMNDDNKYWRDRLSNRVAELTKALADECDATLELKGQLEGMKLQLEGMKLQLVRISSERK